MLADLLRSILPPTWPPLALGSPTHILGERDAVGTARPARSSAVALTVGDCKVFVPAPETAAEPGLAPLVRHADRLFVLPTVRLFPSDRDAPEFLTADEWLIDALTRWRFAHDAGPQTVAATLADLSPEQGLPLVGLAIRFALLGCDRPTRRFGLTFPRFPMTLRPVGDTAFAQAVARQLVLTARLTLDDHVPATDLRAAAYRVQPTLRDFGLDPVHTPEGNDIRLLARLGIGVTVRERRLVPPPGIDVPLSLSTSRIPFAGHDDPRRLLMAANMQTQALDLLAPETPVVRTGKGIDPPGANLLVGYLAHQGLNHEDAWVLSQSGASKLTAIRETTHTLAIRTIELAPRLRVAVGDRVRPGDRLIDRSTAPALLTDDLATLATLPDLDEATPLDPEPGDRADAEAEVVAIECVDLLDHPESGGDLRARFRAVVRVTLREVLPVAIGDKLANRHGHKGIVGAILPDAEMPQVNGRAVEALVDPISVLNRSNWGQLLECRQAGGGPTPFYHGPQFILRLPQRAGEKITLAPSRRMRSPVRYRPQRLGEMDSWALWAHGASPSPTSALSPEVERLGRYLSLAGIELRREADAILIRPLDLAGVPEGATFSLTTDDAATSKRLGVRSLRDLFDDLETGDGPRVLVLPEPVEVATRFVAWLPVLPPEDRPPRRLHDGTEQPHDLTVAYRRVLRALRPRVAELRKAETRDEEEPETTADLDEIRQAIARLMHEAYTLAVGRRATGIDSSKFAHLRRRVLGQRCSGSARAVVAPAGPLGLALDEIGLPEALFVGLGQPERVWLKRDPVLHRHGLLRVRVRPVAGDAIRLPASILGPLNADFDGDTVAVFTHLSGGQSLPATPQESGAFVPGKQYVYGLSLLEESPALAAFEAALHEAGAPTWPTGEGTTVGRLRRWMTATNPKPEWWAILEQHALTALATDPGMGLDLMPANELPKLRAVRCGAAKNLYDDAIGLRLADEFLTGRGLERYRRGSQEFDPIAEVMVAAKAAIGRFGGALRRLVYSFSTLTADDVRLAQTLTEQTTQKALSVKAGQPPVSVHAFERQIRRLLQGEAPDLAPGDDLWRILEPLEPIRAALQARFAQRDEASKPWLAWLRAPHELAELLERFGSLRLPLSDIRLQAWLSESEA